jgi:3-deoxy-D-manno-octulosonic-acid transferase
LVRWIYNLLFPLAFLLLLPGFLRRMVRRGHYRRQFGQRLGIYSAEALARLAQGPPRPWLQAVSVGEMLIALKLIAALRARCPDLCLTLSTTTTTGFRLAEERAGAGVEVVYTPIDALPSVRRALDVLRPSGIIIVEGGLWPNLLWESKRRGLPIVLVNARLSPRSERRFRRFLPLVSHMFRLLDVVCVPEESDILRWRALGVAAERIVRTGSIKFDDSADLDQSRVRAPEVLREFLQALGVESSSPILLGGSTHPGEEKILMESFLRLRRRYPDLFLILAPRHVERAAEIRSEMRTMGIRFVSRTEANNSAKQTAPVRLGALLLDTTGELRDWYALATVVFIGKSLTAIGGQNPAEALAAERAVIFGPHMENFGELAAGLLTAGGAIQVRDGEELSEQCDRLLAAPDLRTDLAVRGRQTLGRHRGAAERTAKLLVKSDGFFPCQIKGGLPY